MKTDKCDGGPGIESPEASLNQSTLCKLRVVLQMMQPHLMPWPKARPHSFVLHRQVSLPVSAQMSGEARA